MKFASLRPDSQHQRDGIPLLIDSRSPNQIKALRLDHLAPSLREIVENWPDLLPQLKTLDEELKKGTGKILSVKSPDLLSPFPRTFQWVDGSAFLHHVKLVRQARNAPIPENLFTTPLMYQGGSDTFLAPTESIPFQDTAYGLDFESEVVVVTDDVPMGVSAENALNYIRLIMIANDVSLRGLIPEELAMGFGFLQSKPSTAFGPFAITVDELGSAWKEGRVQLPLLTRYNDVEFGRPNAAAMHFHFGQLISHAARTRKLSAGTLVGSGTVSNEDESVGSSCLAEKRTIETIKLGKPVTPFMKPGDRVQIEMLDLNGASLFGQIDQKVQSISVK